MDANQRTAIRSDHPTDHVLLQTAWTANESLGFSIVRAVAAVSNRKPTELPPLYEVVDPDGLEELMRSGQERPLEVEFQYCGYAITVTSDGEISVSRPLDEA